MTNQQRKELLNEGKADHFDDPYEYARHLERTGQKHEANLVRRAMNRQEEREDEEELARMWEKENDKK